MCCLGRLGGGWLSGRLGVLVVFLVFFSILPVVLVLVLAALVLAALALALSCTAGLDGLVIVVVVGLVIVITSGNLIITRLFFGLCRRRVDIATLDSSKLGVITRELDGIGRVERDLSAREVRTLICVNCTAAFSGAWRS